MKDSIYSGLEAFGSCIWSSLTTMYSTFEHNFKKKGRGEV